MKKIMLAVMSAIFSIVLCIFAAEISIRLFKPVRYFDSPKGGYLYHPLWSGRERRYWTMRPLQNVCKQTPENGVVCFDTNELGFRGSWLPAKKPGTVRVAAIGDSFAVGWYSPQQDLVTTHLEQTLNQRWKQRVEVINMGVDNWDLFHYYRTLDVFQNTVSPDIVLVFICIANDLEYYRAEFPLQPHTPFERIRFWLERHSYLYSDRLSIPKNWPLQGPKPPPIPEKVRMAVLRAYPGIPKEIGISICLDLHHESRQYLRPPQEAELYSSSIEMLRSIKEKATGRGSRLIFVLVPSKSQVLDSNWAIMKELLRSDGYKDEEIDRTRPEHEILNAANTLGLTVLDLYPEFMKHRAEGLYFLIDGHWNRKGQALAAKIIADSLKR